MPYTRLTTNVAVPDKEALKAALGGLISIIPEKTESRLMLSIHDQQDLYHGGSSEPCAVVETLVNASTDMAHNTAYADAVINTLVEQLGLPPKRIYVVVSRQDFWHSIR